MKIEDRNVVTIINVYAPTSELVKKDRKELEELYGQVEKLLADHRKNSLVIVAGDFNAKIGKRDSDNVEECIGRYTNGKRNKSGQELIDFCSTNDLFITNSAFEHSARHITTWHCQREIDNKIVHIYNQIDYILQGVSQKRKPST